MSYKDETIAYALAAGLVILEDTAAVDRDAERARRRMKVARQAKRFAARRSAAKGA